ncbi:MAG: histidine kinase [Gemmatimonadales bacterium]|jgi:signal transduction histidine kinase
MQDERKTKAELIAELRDLRTQVAKLERESATRRGAIPDAQQAAEDIVRSIPAGLFLYQYEKPDKLILLHGNPEAEALTGIHVDDWVGREFNEIWPEAKASGFTDSCLGVVRSGKPYVTEDLHYKDERLEGAFRIRAFRLPGKRLAVAFENITERKRSEEARRESEGRYRVMLEAIPDLMFRLSSTGVYRDLHIPEGAEDLVAPGTRRGASLYDTLPTEVASEAIGRIKDTLKSGKLQTYEYALQLPVGEHVFESRLVPSGPDEVLTIVRDITERKHLEWEVLEIGEHERQRIGQELHDGLSQQLTTIGFTAKSLEDKLEERTLPEADDARAIQEQVAEALDQTRFMARGLLPLTFDTAGLKSALTDLAAQAEAALGVRCRARVDDEVRIGDEEVAAHLYQIAREATTNAARHGQPETVTIDVANTERGTELRVTDDGVGIQDGADQSGGLGLRIMRYRAQLMDGDIEVSQGPHGGTVVRCSVPGSST